MKKEISLVWFRQDLRISDNEAIAAASSKALPLLPIYIFDDCAPEGFKMGAASKVWLHSSLDHLNQSLKGKLNLYLGPAPQIIERLIDHYAVKNIFWNICYEPWHLTQENSIKDLCKRKSVDFFSFNSNYLYSPDQVLKEDKSYYKLFTPYKKKAYSVGGRAVTQSNTSIEFFKDNENSTTLQGLNLLPQKPWHQKLTDAWAIGEASAQDKLNFFIKHHLSGYAESRNYPSRASVSRLSPHLHFGEISPSQILEALHHAGRTEQNDREHFVSEIMWREFSCYLLYHFKELPIKNFNEKFDHFHWNSNIEFFQAWKKGNTGYPLVDAGMRELWQTGYMHNRVRMVVASFLIKNLNIDWRQGMDWFWNCLLDADLANNSLNWQWVSGSGVDASPYFRVFNPTTQGEKFDCTGEYTKKFVPELKDLPNKYLFKPWSAPAHVLQAAGITLGVTYPLPIIDFISSRKEALQNYKLL